MNNDIDATCNFKLIPVLSEYGEAAYVNNSNNSNTPDTGSTSGPVSLFLNHTPLYRLIHLTEDLLDDANSSSSGSGGQSPTASNSLMLNGTNGFTINGVVGADLSGSSVSSAGDVNGDGIDDILIGAPFGNPNISGQSYVVFGRRGGFGAALNLSTLNGTNGFTINGVAGADLSGSSVSSAGDVNGDGVDDILIGAPFGNADLSGQSYVVFGRRGGFGAVLNLSTLNGSNGLTINGTAGLDLFGTSVCSVYCVYTSDPLSCSVSHSPLNPPFWGTLNRQSGSKSPTCG